MKILYHKDFSDEDSLFIHCMTSDASGFCSVMYNNKDDGMYVYDLHVSPDKQKSGIGSMMLNDIESLGSSLYKKVIYLKIDADSEELYRWFIKKGYIVYSSNEESLYLLKLLPSKLDLLLISESIDCTNIEGFNPNNYRVISIPSKSELLSYLSEFGLPREICFGDEFKNEDVYDYATEIVDYCLTNNLELPAYTIYIKDEEIKKKINELFNNFNTFNKDK